MPKNGSPDWLNFASSPVAMSKARDVHAFFCAMSMLPSQAPSIRSNATRLPPPSTTATFIGWPISPAFFSAAAMIRRASLKVIIESLLLVNGHPRAGHPKGGRAILGRPVILSVLAKDLATCSGRQILREYAQNDSMGER